MATMGFVGGQRRLFTGPRGTRALERPASVWSGINVWVVSWLVGSILLAVVAMLCQAVPQAAPSQAPLTTVQGPTYDAERCEAVTQTWRAADLAADQFRLTRQPEYRADAERLRNQARRDGPLYCAGDPQDR